MQKGHCHHPGVTVRYAAGGPGGLFLIRCPQEGSFAFCFLPMSPQSSVLPFLSLLFRLFLFQLCPIIFVVVAQVPGSPAVLLRACVLGRDRVVKSECPGAQKLRRSGRWKRGKVRHASGVAWVESAGRVWAF